MKKMFMFLFAITLALTLNAEIFIPTGGNDGALLGKKGSSEPKNDFQFQWLEVPPLSIIGSTDTGITTFYPLSLFSRAGHKHLTPDITNLADYKAVKSKLADKALESDHADKADNAVNASSADYATKSDEADSAVVADNGLSSSAPTGTVPIKTQNGWGYTTPDIPRKGFMSNALVKLSDKDYDVGWKPRTVLPSPVKNSVYYIDESDKAIMLPFSKMIDQVTVQYKNSWTWFLILMGVDLLIAGLFIFSIIWIANHSKANSSKN